MFSDKHVIDLVPDNNSAVITTLHRVVSCKLTSFADKLQLVQLIKLVITIVERQS
jgi:hypothetical protein